MAQLCTQCAWFPPELEEAFNQSINNAGKAIPPTSAVLGDALVSLSGHSNLLLLIDALDESRNPVEIIHVLNSVKVEEGIKVFVTSRDEPDINSTLGVCNRIRLELRGDEMSDDIRGYISTRLDNEPKFQWLRPSFKEQIQETLLLKSGGMFRWVQCQIDQILPLRTIRAIRKAMEDLPSGLDNTYERILAQVPRHHIDIVRKVLQWLCFALFPMTLAEMHDAVAIEPDLDFLDEECQLSSPQDILDLCNSLTTVTSAGNIQLAHASVKDYLLSDKIKTSSAADFALDPKETIIDLARYCLAYLSFRELKWGPASSLEEFKARIARFPLLNHAAVAWPNQLLDAGQPAELDAEVMRFLTADRSAFMSWVQILNALPGLGKDATTAWASYPTAATPLYYASSFGLSRAVAALIATGVDLDAAASRFGGTALHGAVVRHHLPVIELLLAAGADATKSDFNSMAPLHTAVWHGEDKIASLLMKHGAIWSGVDDEPQMWDGLPTTASKERSRDEVEIALPGHTDIQRFLDQPEKVKSFDVFV